MSQPGAKGRKLTLVQTEFWGEAALAGETILVSLHILFWEENDMRSGPWQVLIFGVVVALRVMLAVVDVWTSEVRLKSEMLLVGGWPFHA